jgi:serine protease Do
MTTLRRLHLYLPLLAASLAGVIGAAFLQGPPPMASGPQQTSSAFVRLSDEENTIAIIRRYAPCVVAVRVAAPESGISGEIPGQTAGGSGFVVDEQGRIVTNFHVVMAALEDGTVELREGASITVSYQSAPQIEFPVRVQGANLDIDLALLEPLNGVQRPNTGYIPLGNSDLVVVGQKVIAIGNPFGLQSTVTTGIVSAIERGIPALAGLEIPFIQTDAAINPGNSGGPLLNSSGEVIGINNAILSPGGTFAGIGFAVPSNMLLESFDQLAAGGLSGFAVAAAGINARPRLGIVVEWSLDNYPETIRQEYGLPQQGAVIAAVAPDGPAAKAGLKAPETGIAIGDLVFPVDGDIITALDGVPVNSVRDIQRHILEKEEGDRVRVTAWRDGSERVVEVELALVPPSE